MCLLACFSLIKSLFCHRLFGGFILDIKRKAPHYLSDYTDAVSLQCLASFLFLYCACMSPVITFGGLLGEATEGRVVRSNTFIAPRRLYNHTERFSFKLLHSQGHYIHENGILKLFRNSRYQMLHLHILYPEKT